MDETRVISNFDSDGASSGDENNENRYLSDFNVSASSAMYGSSASGDSSHSFGSAFSQARTQGGQQQDQGREEAAAAIIPQSQEAQSDRKRRAYPTGDSLLPVEDTGRRRRQRRNSGDGVDTERINPELFLSNESSLGRIGLNQDVELPSRSSTGATNSCFQPIANNGAMVPYGGTGDPTALGIHPHLLSVFLPYPFIQLLNYPFNNQQQQLASSTTYPPNVAAAPWSIMPAQEGEQSSGAQKGYNSTLITDSNAALCTAVEARHQPNTTMTAHSRFSRESQPFLQVLGLQGATGPPTAVPAPNLHGTPFTNIGAAAFTNIGAAASGVPLYSVSTTTWQHLNNTQGRMSNMPLIPPFAIGGGGRGMNLAQPQPAGREWCMNLAQPQVAGSGRGTNVPQPRPANRGRGTSLAQSQAAQDTNLTLPQATDRGRGTNLTHPQVAGRGRGTSLPQPPAAELSKRDRLEGPPIIAAPFPVEPSPGVIMYLPTDDDRLSEFQILVRKQIEYFEAQEEDLTTSSQGRKKQLYIGQVGLRCKHCYFIQRRRGKGALYFPMKLINLYQAAQNMASTHLCDSCLCIDASIKAKLSKLREVKFTASGGKQYWANAGKAVGLVETERGLRWSCERARFVSHG